MTENIDPKKQANKKYDATRVKLCSAVNLTPADAEKMKAAMDTLDAHYPSRRAGILAAVLAHSKELAASG